MSWCNLNIRLTPRLLYIFIYALYFMLRSFSVEKWSRKTTELYNMSEVQCVCKYDLSHCSFKKNNNSHLAWKDKQGRLFERWFTVNRVFIIWRIKEHLKVKFLHVRTHFNSMKMMLGVREACYFQLWGIKSAKLSLYIDKQAAHVCASVFSGGFFRCGDVEKYWFYRRMAGCDLFCVVI